MYTWHGYLSGEAKMECDTTVSNPKGKSTVWQHFGFPGDSDGVKLSDKKLVCRLCKSIIRYSGNTSNLTYHLSKQHTAKYAQLQKPGESSKSAVIKKMDSKQLTLSATVGAPAQTS